MHFPRYWALGTSGEYSCWQWSDSSVADAKARADVSAAKLAAARATAVDRRARYEYGHRPLREPIIEEIHGAESKSRAVITRNSYGALVLNTTEICFVDIDFDDAVDGTKRPGFFAALFGAGKKSSTKSAEERSIEQLDGWFTRNPSWGGRLYRTKGGLRLLITSHLLDPMAATTEQLFGELGADPLYCRLCKSQGSFRARLTPKPWRIDRVPPSQRWPFASTEEEERFKKWEADYRDQSGQYATCRFLKSLGAALATSGTEKVITRHDELTAASSGLALA